MRALVEQLSPRALGGQPFSDRHFETSIGSAQVCRCPRCTAQPENGWALAENRRSVRLPRRVRRLDNASMQGKRVLLGVTGGIAAYKSPDLVRRLRERGADVQVVMTA